MKFIFMSFWARKQQTFWL